MSLSASPELQVNTYAAADQTDPQITALASGNYLVSWFDTGDVFGQLYSPSGARLGDNLVLGPTNTGATFSVAATSNGGFAVAYYDRTLDGAGSDITIRQYSATGGGGGATLHLTSPSSGYDINPSITGLAGGGFAVAFTAAQSSSNTLYLQRYDAGGAALGTLTTIATTAVGSSSTARPDDAHITQLSDGSFEVAYAAEVVGSSGAINSANLRLQHLSANGAPDPSLTDMGAFTAGGVNPNAEDLSIKATTDGGFVVAWTKADGQTPVDVEVAKFDASGARVAQTSQPVDSSWDSAVGVSANSDGGYTLAYTGLHTDVTLLTFDAHGTQVGEAVRVNTTTAGDQRQAAVASVSNGHYAVAWNSYGQDGDRGGIYTAQVTDGSTTATAAGQHLAAAHPGGTVLGTDGDDTITASAGGDRLSGGAGADDFVFNTLPYSFAHISDFAVGTDRLDFSALFQASGYTGSDPVRDGYISLQSNGSAGTKVMFDADGPNANGQWPYFVVNLDSVAYSSNLTWAQLTGTAAPPPASAPQLVLANGTVTFLEGNAGTHALDFNVNRTGDTSGTSTVHWSVVGTGDHPADAADFGGVLPSGTLTFTPGEAAEGIRVVVTGDTTPEFDETFSVVLSDASGATIGTNYAHAVISNDDGTPTSTGGTGTGTGSGTGSGGGTGGDTIPSGSGGGEDIVSNNSGGALIGGPGNDTITIGQGPEVVTGNGGADIFIFNNLPWNAGHITDFTLGTDRLDLSNLFRGSGYTGSDPIADGYVTLVSDGGAGTEVLYDTDGRASGNTIQFRITDLDHVAPSGLSWAALSGGGSTGTGAGTGGTTGSSGSGSAGAGQVLTSHQYADTLAGGAGNDTLNAGQGPDQLTGAGGADHFVFASLPWNAGHITDFTPVSDILDLRPLFQAAGYTGADPIADHWLEFRSDGAGSTQVYFDNDGPSGSNWPTLITTIDHVNPGQIHSGDWLFH